MTKKAANNLGRKANSTDSQSNILDSPPVIQGEKSCPWAEMACHGKLNWFKVPTLEIDNEGGTQYEIQQ